MIAVLVSWPIGWLYLYWSFFTALDLLRYFRGGVVGCSQSWQSLLNSCLGTGYSPTLTIVELLVGSAVGVVFAYGMGRWVMQPVGTMADTVARFGPNSVGLRLRPGGPHDETRRLAEAIDAMLDRLAEGYEAQRRFASTASHELRTPLATQRALIEVSLSSALTPEQLDLLSRQLLATNERNEQLVEGLLTLAETDRGLAASSRVRIDELARDTADLLRGSAKERDVELETDLAPLTVLGEPPLLERLVVNLLQNAIKYNVADGTVQVAVQRDGVLQVINTGPLVPPDLVPGLFEPFRRLSGERLDHGGGVGLGLTIARSIVAAHGGAIEAVANPRGGLTVIVRLHPAP
jgi:signal transduction histidine kinase